MTDMLLTDIQKLKFLQEQGLFKSFFFTDFFSFSSRLTIIHNSVILITLHYALINCIYKKKNRVLVMVFKVTLNTITPNLLFF